MKRLREWPIFFCRLPSNNVAPLARPLCLRQRTLPVLVQVLVCFNERQGWVLRYLVGTSGASLCAAPLSGSMTYFA